MRDFIIFLSLVGIYFIPTFIKAEEGFLTREESITVAKNAVKLDSKNFPNWKNATINQVREIYSSNDIIVGYEMSIIDKKGNGQGFIIVNRNKRERVISTFLETGESSILQDLMSYYESSVVKFIEKNNLTPTDVRFLGMLPYNFAIGVKFDEKNINMSKLKMQGLDLSEIKNQDGWFIFAPEFHSEVDFHFTETARRSARGWYDFAEEQERSMLLEDLLKGNEDSKFFKVETSKSIESLNSSEPRKKSASIRDDEGFNDYTAGNLFPNFYQEKRNWTKGSTGNCIAGCTPVSWATLLSYYDKEYHPELISSKYDNYNWSTKDPDVRWTINEIRGWLGTSCNGNTSLYNVVKGEHYIQGRGLNASSSRSYIYIPLTSRWWKLISEIDENRPVIASIDSTGRRTLPNHSVVAHSYMDNWGNSNDKFKVKYGWKTKTDAWVYKKDLYGMTSVEIWN